MGALQFRIEKSTPSSGGRAGVITTPHGEINTPAFVPVGTKANVKGIFPDALRRVGAQVIIANTYHLYLSPGEQIVRDGGGVAKFMNWPGLASPKPGEGGPTMTDSGGFQVFSLGAAFGRNITKIAKGEETSRPRLDMVVYDEEVQSQHGQLAIIDDEGVTFTSHLDGTLHRFTPERSVEIQHALGADIFFAFDECTAPTETYEYQKEAMERTHRWAERSLKAHRQKLPTANSPLQSIFGIVQGGRHEDLRRASAKEIASMEFDGFGIGGSFSKEDMQGALQAAVGELPPEKPRHFLGIGEPSDILDGIAHGMDTFDCVAPTRIGRHGSIYTKRGIVHLPNQVAQTDFGPLDPETPVEGLEGFTRAYVSHLVRSKEMLGAMICSLHNEGFILKLVADARQAILDGHFEAFCTDFKESYYHSL